MRVQLSDLPERARKQLQGKLDKQAPIPRPPSTAEETFWLQCQGLNELPEREFRFHPTRKWRFDFAWPEHKFAVEIEGITHQHGRHQRKDGFEKDLEKYEAAMLQGWNVYRCSQAMVKTGNAIQTACQMLKPSVFIINN